MTLKNLTMKITTNKEIRHYAPAYLLNPSHPISVLVAGVGGTGSIVAVNLLKIHTCLKALGNRGLDVYLYDHDSVGEENMGRQGYYPGDIGRKKVHVLAERLNAAAGEYVFRPTDYHVNRETFITHGNMMGNYTRGERFNILMGCVDNMHARDTLFWELRNHHVKTTPEFRSYYYIDFGNNFDSGQVIMGSKLILQDNEKNSRAKLLCAQEMMPEAMEKVKEKTDEPSCSLREAIGKQDLFINSIIADQGCMMLWNLLRFGSINYNAVFINLESGIIKRNKL